MKLLSRVVAVALLGASAMAASPATAQIADGSFEMQGAASNGTSGYCYFGPNTYGTGPCAGGSWTGAGTSGFQGENNTAWPGAQTPDGSYYAFIQSGYGTPGSIAQTFTLGNAGLYSLSWLAAGRPAGVAGGDQAYTVTLGNNTFSGATTTGQPFTGMSSGPLLLAAGTYTLSFTAADQAGDNTAFIDGVSLSAVPEPATWGMMVLGFGMVGFGLRSRRRAKATPRAHLA